MALLGEKVAQGRHLQPANEQDQAQNPEHDGLSDYLVSRRGPQHLNVCQVFSCGVMKLT
jgi:hypothetical protein